MTNAACRQELASLRDQKAELESRIMGNALLISELGLLNQRNAGLTRACTLLAASRAEAGSVIPPEPQVPYDLAGELAVALAAIPPLTDAERREMHAAARPSRSYWHDEEGNIMPVDYSDLVSPAPSSPRDTR